MPVDANPPAIVEQLHQKVRALEQQTRLELAGLSREIRVERRIADDERKALHARVDSLEETMLKEFRKLEKLIRAAVRVG